MPLGLFWQPALLEVITRNPVRGHLLRKLSPVCTSHPNPGLGPPPRRLKGPCPREGFREKTSQVNFSPLRLGVECHLQVAHLGHITRRVAQRTGPWVFLAGASVGYGRRLKVWWWTGAQAQPAPLEECQDELCSADRQIMATYYEHRGQPRTPMQRKCVLLGG